MLCIGYKNIKFKASDNSEIKGTNLYLAEKLIGNHCDGQSCEKIFVSENKLAKMGFEPTDLFGSELRVLYNRYGKIESIEVI